MKNTQHVFMDVMDSTPAIKAVKIYTANSVLISFRDVGLFNAEVRLNVISDETFSFPKCCRCMMSP